MNPRPAITPIGNRQSAIVNCLLALCLCVSALAQPMPPQALRAEFQSNLVSAAVAPVLTNKPLVVEFDPVPPVWFTNVNQQIVTGGNASLIVINTNNWKLVVK